MIIELADRLQGVKPYYFVQKLEQVRQMLAEGKDVINFGIGSPDLAPSDAAKDAAIAQTQSDLNHGYQAYAGIPELRQAMADFYSSTYGVKLNPAKEVLPLMGSKEGILHLLLAFANPGDKVLVPNPGYPTYTSLAKLLGVQIEYYDLKEENGWYPDFEEMAKKDLSRVKLLWMNYPHMPTGTPAKKEIFEQAVAFAKKHKVLICHDNPYSLVLNQKAPTSILSLEGAKEVAVELNSLSKSHNMAGWRVGMIVGEAEYISNVLRVKSNIANDCPGSRLNAVKRPAIGAFTFRLAKLVRAKLKLLLSDATESRSCFICAACNARSTSRASRINCRRFVR